MAERRRKPKKNSAAKSAHAHAWRGSAQHQRSSSGMKNAEENEENRRNGENVNRKSMSDESNGKTQKKNDNEKQ
jgi:hypothetical protein